MINKLMIMFLFSLLIAGCENKEEEDFIIRIASSSDKAKVVVHTIDTENDKNNKYFEYKLSEIPYTHDVHKPRYNKYEAEYKTLSYEIDSALSRNLLIDSLINKYQQEFKFDININSEIRNKNIYFVSILTWNSIGENIFEQFYNIGCIIKKKIR